MRFTLCTMQKCQSYAEDLKAENVILTNEGEVKLVDFDIARIYQPGKSKDTVMMGTQGYAAPGTVLFGQTDARTDIYAMGVFNYMLVREFPMEKLTEGKFRTIVLKCIKINPEDRYQNVDELKADICSSGNSAVVWIVIKISFIVRRAVKKIKPVKSFL